MPSTAQLDLQVARDVELEAVGRGAQKPDAPHPARVAVDDHLAVQRGRHVEEELAVGELLAQHAFPRCHLLLICVHLAKVHIRAPCLAEASLADAHASSWPGLFLLHTGNIGKLRDSAVPPSMRRLGLSLQDLFVPRSDEPCSLDSSLPLHLRTCHTLTQLWRARLKGQGDCRLVAPSPQPLLWTPYAGAAVRAQRAPTTLAAVRALRHAFLLRLSPCLRRRNRRVERTGQLDSGGVNMLVEHCLRAENDNLR